MLPPEEFGAYLATGTLKRAKEEAVFFDVNTEKLGDAFDMAPILKRCVADDSGLPKHSVYASVYRVLERVPLEALGSLWLTTPDGRVLELKCTAPPESFLQDHYLVQELAPVHPLVATDLNPVDFIRFITDPDKPVSLPKICFVTLDLAGLDADPKNGDASTLPYKNIDHLRDCLCELQEAGKQTKTVDRIHSQHIHFRCISGGFFVGEGDDVLFYPFPSGEDLDVKHHNWWRSANLC
jgi:hypothetical protein